MDEKVDEARPGDFGLLDLVRVRQGGDQPLCQFARVHPRLLTQHQRQIAGEVAVRLVFGVRHLNAIFQILWQSPLLLQRGKCCFQQVLDVCFHGQ